MVVTVHWAATPAPTPACPYPTTFSQVLEHSARDILGGIIHEYERAARSQIAPPRVRHARQSPTQRGLDDQIGRNFAWRINGSSGSTTPPRTSPLAPHSCRFSRSRPCIGVFGPFRLPNERNPLPSQFWRRPLPAPKPLTFDQVIETLIALHDLPELLERIDQADRAALYQALGLTVRYRRVGSTEEVKLTSTLRSMDLEQVGRSDNSNTPRSQA
jgi:hypothetical protein